MYAGQRSRNTEDRDKHEVGPAPAERVIFSNFIRIGLSWLMPDGSKERSRSASLVVAKQISRCLRLGLWSCKRTFQGMRRTSWTFLEYPFTNVKFQHDCLLSPAQNAYNWFDDLLLGEVQDHWSCRWLIIVVYGYITHYSAGMDYCPLLRQGR